MLDEEIIGLIYSNNKRGIEELKNKYNDIILNMVKSILNDKKDIDRCLDMTYERINTLIPPYVPKYLRAFVLKCSREIAIDIYKEKNKNLINELDVDLDIAFSIDDYLYVENLVKDINRFVNKLNLDDSIIFIRRYFFNEDIKTIADKFELKEKKINERLKKIMMIFKKFLEVNGYEIKASKH